MKILMRKKGKFRDGTTKYILERIEGKKTVETRTVFKPEHLWELHRPSLNEDKPSQKDIATQEKDVQKCVQDLLTEPKEEDVSGTILTDEDRESLWRMSK